MSWWTRDLSWRYAILGRIALVEKNPLHASGEWSRLATWTTYRNYREQLARHESVQLEKKNVDLFLRLWSLLKDIAALEWNRHAQFNARISKSFSERFIFRWAIIVEQIIDQSRRVSNFHTLRIDQSGISYVSRWSFGIFLWSLFLKCSYPISDVLYL